MSPTRGLRRLISHCFVPLKTGDIFLHQLFLHQIFKFRKNWYTKLTKIGVKKAKNWCKKVNPKKTKQIQKM